MTHFQLETQRGDQLFRNLEISSSVYNTNCSVPSTDDGKIEVIKQWCEDAAALGGQIKFIPYFNESSWCRGNIYMISEWGENEINLKVDYTGRVLSLHDTGWLPTTEIRVKRVDTRDIFRIDSENRICKRGRSLSDEEIAQFLAESELVMKLETHPTYLAVYKHPTLGYFAKGWWGYFISTTAEELTRLYVFSIPWKMRSYLTRIGKMPEDENITSLENAKEIISLARTELKKTCEKFNKIFKTEIEELADDEYPNKKAIWEIAERFEQISKEGGIEKYLSQCNREFYDLMRVERKAILGTL